MYYLSEIGQMNLGVLIRVGLYGIWEFCNNLEFLICNFCLLSAATAVQYIQGNGDSHIISEYSWQYIHTTVWGYHRSRFPPAVACFSETG